MSASAAESVSYRLPTPPQLLAKIIQAAGSEDSSVVALGRLTCNDPSFAAEILRLANSPLYQRGAQINSVMRAVAVLGVRGLRNIALCWAARNCVDPKELGSFDLRRFWEDSLRRAVSAQLLAEHLSIMDPMEAFTMGLLQDIGVLALVMNQPEASIRWMDFVNHDPDNRRTLESELFGSTHDEIARKMIEIWSLPPELGEPMLFHHDWENCGEQLRQRCKLARWSEILAGLLTCADKRTSLERARKALTDEASLSHEDVDLLASKLGERVESTAQQLGMKVDAQPSLQSIVMAANKSLAEMNLNYEELVSMLEETLAKLEQSLAEKRSLARQLEERNLELQTLSLTDPLSGLPNRRAFSNRMADEVTRLARSGGPLTLLIGDIDHFKGFNDKHGHDFGDEVLKLVAITMHAVVRQTDLVARIGGEEFAILLPATDRSGGLVVAKNILGAIRKKKIKTPGGESTNVTISLGLATLEGPYKKNHTVDDVVNRVYKAADASLYASKHGGRDRVTDYPNPVPWTNDKE